MTVVTAASPSLLQLSDPHLQADPAARLRGVDGHAALSQALTQCVRRCGRPDLLLLSGDLCHDESWIGYARLRDLLHTSGCALALLAGNHDDPALLRAALGRQAVLAPAALALGAWRLLLLDSHQPGRLGGRLGERQRHWLAGQLSGSPAPVVVALHHPPVPIGDPGLDAIALEDGPALMALLRPLPGPVVVLFGHIHQHWQNRPPGAGGPQADAGHREPLLLGCPSTLAQFPAVQPCPLGREHDPGGRWLALGAGGDLRQQLLRWPAVHSP